MFLLKCPECGTVFSHDEKVCGICGHSLSTVSSESFDEIQREVTSEARSELLKENREMRQVEKKRIEWALSEFFSGIAIMLLGLILLVQFRNLYGVLVMVVGFGLLAHAVALPYGYWGRSWRTISRISKRSR